MQNLLEQSFTLQSLLETMKAHAELTAILLYFVGMFVIGLPCLRWVERQPSTPPPYPTAPPNPDSDLFCNGLALLLYPLAVAVFAFMIFGKALKQLGKLV